MSREQAANKAEVIAEREHTCNALPRHCSDMLKAALHAVTLFNDLGKLRVVCCLIESIVSLTTLLVCTVIGYIIFDIRLGHAGLFRSAGMPIAAVFLALIVVAALIAIAYTIKTVVKER